MRLWKVGGLCLLGGWIAAAQSPTPMLGARAELSARAQVTRHANYSEAQIRTAGGTELREFVAPSGEIFGVAWQGARMPDLRAILGQQRFAEYQKAAAKQRRRRGPLSVKIDAMVIENSGHMRDFHGRVYLAGAIPAGVSPAVIR